VFTIASKTSVRGSIPRDAGASRRPDRSSARDPGAQATIDQRIWLTVSAIPEGCVATYGDVAERAGLPGAARRVGTALRRLPPDSAVPWHRVVNAGGRSSLPPGASGADRQLALLAAEGVLLGSGGRAVLERYRWT
jgi:methylated-DNA-protein-cysteine methyltransferase-like protein